MAITLEPLAAVESAVESAIGSAIGSAAESIGIDPKAVVHKLDPRGVVDKVDTHAVVEKLDPRSLVGKIDPRAKARRARKRRRMRVTTFVVLAVGVGGVVAFFKLRARDSSGAESDLADPGEDLGEARPALHRAVGGA